MVRIFVVDIVSMISNGETLFKYDGRIDMSETSQPGNMIQSVDVLEKELIRPFFVGATMLTWSDE